MVHAGAYPVQLVLFCAMNRLVYAFLFSCTIEECPISGYAFICMILEDDFPGDELEDHFQSMHSN